MGEEVEKNKTKTKALKETKLYKQWGKKKSISYKNLLVLFYHHNHNQLFIYVYIHIYTHTYIYVYMYIYVYKSIYFLAVHEEVSLVLWFHDVQVSITAHERQAGRTDPTAFSS